MNVAEALQSRRSVRSFRQDPVAPGLVRSILERAARSPSGGNLQPWNVHALGGPALSEVKLLASRNGPDPEPGYTIYPDKLWVPYRSRRFQCGEDLYATIGVPRDDKEGRLAQLARNAEFFGAPVGIFVTVDRKMGPPQWADLGMYIQSVMLLAAQEGLDTCAQEYWTLYARTVESYLNVTPDHMLFAG